MIYLLANLQSQVLQFNPDIVTLCVLLNELGDTQTGQRITDYVNACLAHVNPNGKSPILLLMTDNFCGQNIGSAYVRTVAEQDAAHVRIMNAYNSFSANPNIFVSDNYPAFKALGVDTVQLYSVLDSVRVHPNDAGYKIFINNMKNSLYQTITRFFNQ